MEQPIHVQGVNASADPLICAQENDWLDINGFLIDVHLGNAFDR